MSHNIEEKHYHIDQQPSNFAFRIISVIHDNPLLPLFRKPDKLLKAAGLKRGQKVLEVGCGPGFFTIPAAKIVGEEGFIYAVDVHPLAIERIQQKIKREGVKNVKPILANASESALPHQSVDLAFLFGLGHIAGGL
jgi:ubiquinone/menaquinone biosynthesis C-methylase UbiE